MKQKGFKTFYIALFATIIMVLLFVAGCTKADDTYRNYKTTAGTYSGNALQYLQSQPGVYDSMLLVITRLKGMPELISGGSITLFAVSNRSFSLALQNINQARKDSLPSMAPVTLSTIDSATLDEFFGRYIIEGRQSTDSLVGYTDGRLFPSVRHQYNMQMQLVQTNASGFLEGGPKSIIFSDPKNSVFTRNWVRVNTITVDIKTENAIVHLLPPGHDFGFGTDFIRLVNKR